MTDTTVFKIESLTGLHYQQVKEIYQQGINSGIATFETMAPDWKEWDNSHLTSCRLVALDKGKVCGWASLSKVSDRCVYEGVAEVSVYVHTAHYGKSIGSLLLAELIRQSEEAGIWTLQAVIFPENIASIRLHEKHGFRIIGIREKPGKLKNIWKDVKLMERRSKRVGID